MNKVCLIIIIMFVIFVVFLILFFGLGEYLRQTSVFQHFDNVDTSNASFSLTTTPSRINDLEPTLKSLIKQKPKTIYLNVPWIFKKTGEKYVIPKWLESYKNKVTIIRTEDKGPATKFLGLLNYNINPEEYICIVDDDNIYDELLLSNLVHKANQFDGEHVISNAVFYAPPKVYGTYGFIFKRKLLNNIVNYPTSAECFLVDDPWITAYFLHNDIPITKLASGIWATKPSDSITDYYKNFVNEVTNVIKQSGKNPLWISRAIDANLNCVKSIHTDKEMNQHNKDIFEYLYD